MCVRVSVRVCVCVGGGGGGGGDVDSRHQVDSPSVIFPYIIMLILNLHNYKLW